jgi:ribosomal protein S18 acetylase RimI-like enzyme
VVHYRTFRNSDPPRLVQIWNEVFAGQGAAKLLSSTPLERCIFGKPYFDPAGLTVAEEDGTCLGFAHAGFGADPQGTHPGTSDGVVCALAVRPAQRRHGIGSKLLELSEGYLRQRGAQVLFAGPHPGRNPFYLGLYGGSNSPGFLLSHADAEPFFLHHHYRPWCETLVFQRSLAEPVRLIDPRLAAFRNQFDLRVGMRKAHGSLWEEAVWSGVELLEFVLEEKAGLPVARAWAWETEGYAGRWTTPAVGIVNLHVNEGRRRTGLGKFFLGQILRALQEQFFEVAEIQVDQTNTAGVQFCRALGFGQVDTGRAYQKEQ